METLADVLADDVRSGDVETKMLFAGLAAIVGSAVAGTDDGMFKMLENACRYFGVPSSRFDELAACLDFHYDSVGDCYLSREELAEARRRDRFLLH